MTNVRINPGVCGLITRVKAQSDPDGMEVQLTVASACEAVRKMFKELGDTFDPYEICLAKPGCGPLYNYAADHFPGHCSCPAIAGITKCAEVECRLALPKNAEIVFEENQD